MNLMVLESFILHFHLLILIVSMKITTDLKILISVDASLFRNSRRLTCKWLQGVQPVVKL